MKTEAEFNAAWAGPVFMHHYVVALWVVHVNYAPFLRKLFASSDSP